MRADATGGGGQPEGNGDVVRLQLDLARRRVSALNQEQELMAESQPAS
jgi:hypothetical protein